MRKKFTVSLLVVFTALLIAWDIYVAVVEKGVPAGTGATISEIVYGFAKEHPPFPFLIGVVAGHLLWAQVRTKPPEDRVN